MTHHRSPTEAENPRSAGLDLLTTPALVELLIADQRAAVDAALAQTQVIAQAVDEIARRLSRGGRLHYVGAGSSGRIATLDASEMPPTFGTPPEMVQAHIAGGSTALTSAVEGAEDDAGAGDVTMLECVRAGDTVLGISASGTAAFVVAAIARAATIGAYTIAVTADAQSALARAAELAIVPPTGAEALAGSTRLKAGTAQKVVLNAISTAVMVRLGKVYDNLMVDVVANNRKLRGRALRLVARLAQVSEERAEELLARAGGRVKIAVVMESRGVDAMQARDLLERNDGTLRRLL
ncbi:MAG: N-acetylmuramic acid 6-phosphate etherase [Candidatus Cybelea sp.]